MGKLLIEFWLEEDAQATEYMVAIAVVVIAIVGATIVFKPSLRSGMTTWGDNYHDAYGDPNGLPIP